MPFPTRWPLRLVAPLLLLACGLANSQTPPNASATSAPAIRASAVVSPGGAAAAAVPSSAGSPQDVAAPAPGIAPVAPAVPAAALSRDARRIYELSRDKLVQIRTLLRNSNTQASIGSGFFVSADGLIVTNFHVASQLALEPERYSGAYVTIDGQEGAVELLAFDVQRDLAVLRAKNRTASAPVLEFRPAAEAMAQGERIYSLGNPLDIGFAVTEGTYNGLVRRSFYPRIFFGGALNPGMSGGPAVDDAGRVLGVNVAKRLDGEQVSFSDPGRVRPGAGAARRHAQPITQPRTTK
jgi:serine protease Do